MEERNYYGEAKAGYRERDRRRQRVSHPTNPDFAASVTNAALKNRLHDSLPAALPTRSYTLVHYIKPRRTQLTLAKSVLHSFNTKPN